MENYDEDYYKYVNGFETWIQQMKEELIEFKTTYISSLYEIYEREGNETSPQAQVQSWLDSVWNLCQSGNSGHKFNIYSIDRSMILPNNITTALESIHYVGCTCPSHPWPCHWNVKPEHYREFKESITPQISKAFKALGLKINISENNIFHSWGC
jgi:hypothetical protein